MNDRELMWSQTTNKSHIHPHVSEKHFWHTGMMYAKEHLTMIRPYETVLDYGCGVGRISKYIKCKKLFLADVNRQFLQEAIRETGGFEWVFQDTTWAIAISVFIHMSHKQALETFRNLAESCDKMLLQMPIYDSPREGNDWIDVTTYSLDQLIGWAEDANFTLASYHTNDGIFSYENIGINHAKPQLFIRS